MRAFRLRAAIWRLAIGYMLLAGALIAALVYSHVSALIVGAALLGIYFVGHASFNPDTKAEELSVHADATGLALGNRRIDAVPIRRARVMPRDDGAWVEVDRARPRLPLRLHLESTAEARELVAALGFDASRARDRFRMASPLTRSLVFNLALQLAFQFGFPLGGVAFVGLGLAVMLLILVDERLRYVEVGPDGVFVRTLVRRSYLATSTLRGVRRLGTQGKSREVEVEGSRCIAVWIYERELRAFESRVAELVATNETGSGAGTTDGASVLEGRDASELRALASRSTTFRAEGIDRDTLLRIVENVHLAPGLRARAAVALPDDVEVRTRIHNAAANAALPELRVALERAGHGADEVDAALEDLDRAVRRE